MKLLHASLLALMSLLLIGCIGEDRDGCDAEDNLVLEFRYYGDGQEDVFSQNIVQVDVFVFDESDHLVLWKSLDQASLTFFGGTRMSLSSGVYRIVCWGNVVDKAVFKNVTPGCSFADVSVGNRSMDDDSGGINGDPLFYAPTGAAPDRAQVFSVTIAGAGIQSETIVFRCAHIRTEVYVRGFQDRSAQGLLLPPVISLTDLLAQVDFDRRPFGPAVTFRSASSFSTINGVQLAVLTFCTPLFEADAPVQLLVGKQSDGSVLTTIDLAEFIAEHAIPFSSFGLTVIPVLVEYTQLSVKISLPDWIYNPVDPIL